MRFTVTIDTDNAEFHTEDGLPDLDAVARSLVEVARKLRVGRISGNTHAIRDINGNTVGRFALEA